MKVKVHPDRFNTLMNRYIVGITSDKCLITTLETGRNFSSKSGPLSDTDLCDIFGATSIRRVTQEAAEYYEAGVHSGFTHIEVEERMYALVGYNSVEIEGMAYYTPLSETESHELPDGWDYHCDSDEGSRRFKYDGVRRWVDNDMINKECPVMLVF